MKKNHLITTIILILVFSCIGLNADTFHSVADGGDWHVADTWEEGAVPGAGDDVIISGPGEVIVFNNQECNHLTIASGAILKNRVNGSRTLIVHGNVVNHGSIENSNYHFTILAEGNLNNTGSITNFRIKFTGNNGHALDCALGNPIACENFEAADTTGNLTLSSNIEFSGVPIDLNHVSIEGNHYSIKLMNGSQVDNATISDFTLLGKFICRYGNSFEGQIIVEDTLYKPHNLHITLNVDGDLTNNGVITRPNYNFIIDISGDIINNGYWECTNLRLSGTTTQYISQGSGKVFNCSNFTDDDISSDIEALSDLSFHETEIDLNGGTLKMTASKGGSFSMDGGLLEDAIIQGNAASFIMSNGAYIYSNTILSNVTLEGIVQIRGSNNELNGEIINNGKLRNYNNTNVSVNINGNLTNNDTITDPNYSLWLYITGNITNNGVWSNNNTFFSGTETHTLNQAPTAIFSGNNFKAESLTGIITASSDLLFMGTTIDLNGDTLIMQSSKGGTLSQIGGIIQNANLIMNAGNLFMDNDAYIYSNVSISDVTLEGTVMVRGSNNEFHGEIINNAYFRNYNNSNVTIVIDGNIMNNDTIIDPNYDFNLHINGNLNNKGFWQNEITGMTGIGSHNIEQSGAGIISAKNFYAENGTGIINILSDFTFYETDIQLNGGTLNVSEGIRLSVLGSSGNAGLLANGKISGEAFEIKGNAYTSFQNLEIEADVSVYGEYRVNGNSNIFSGELNVIDTLCNKTNTNSSIDVAGRIVNNGIIKNNGPYDLDINCQGHIINNGIWTNEINILDGVDDQLIYLIAGKEITAQFRFSAMIDDPPYQWQWNGEDLDSPDFSGENSSNLNWLVPVSNDYNGNFKCFGVADSSRTLLIRGGIIIDPVVQLQGAYNGVDMNTHLAEQNLIPLQQPFNISPWNYDGDEEVTLIPGDIVDWILVELRQTSGGPETATSDSIVMRRALMLRNDGRVVDPFNQTPELKYDIDLTDDIYLVVWHRNHLGIMSSVPISDGLSPAFYDFSTAASQAYGGTDAQADLGNGIYGMLGGDADYNQQITNQDFNAFWPANAGHPCGYETYDFSLDAQFNNIDKNQTWVKTLGAETQVPE